MIRERNKYLFSQNQVLTELALSDTVLQPSVLYPVVDVCAVCRQCFHSTCPHSTAICPLKPDTSAAARAIAFTATPQVSTLYLTSLFELKAVVMEYYFKRVNTC